MQRTPARVLLVEDDRFLRRASELHLSRLGLAVTVARDGEQGLELAAADPPDLVLLDMLMPKVTGLEVLRALRAAPATRDVPVIVLSNSSREQDIADVQALGVVDYLIKANVSLEELARRVMTCLDRGSRGDGIMRRRMSLAATESGNALS